MTREEREKAVRTHRCDPLDSEGVVVSHKSERLWAPGLFGPPWYHVYLQGHYCIGCQEWFIKILNSNGELL